MFPQQRGQGRRAGNGPAFAFGSVFKSAAIATGPVVGPLADRFTLIPTLPFPLADEWRSLAATLEDALRLRRHQTGTLSGLDRYLHQRTSGMIGRTW